MKRTQRFLTYKEVINSEFYMTPIKKQTFSHLKTSITIILVLLSINLTAQSWFGKTIKGNNEKTTITRTTSNYEKISVAGPFDINLVKGKEGKLTITIENNLVEYLVTEVKNGKLSIKWKKLYRIKPNAVVRITVPFNKIEAVSLAGSGSYNGTDKITAHDFDIELAGSGSIDLHISSQDVDCSMAGSGDITLKGDSREFDCSKAGSGDLFGFDFKCENIELEEVGSGDAEIYVTNNLQASIAGSGNIYYKGNPAKNNIKVAGSGSAIMK
ncbi:MAG: head GIN domain-containing protein [Bacteroidota bacterium]